MTGTIIFPLQSGYQANWPLSGISNLHVVTATSAVAFNISNQAGTEYYDFSYTASDIGSANRIVAQIQQLIVSGSNSSSVIIDNPSPSISGITISGNIVTVAGSRIGNAAYILMGDGTQLPVNQSASSAVSAVSFFTNYNPSPVPGVSLVDSMFNIIATYPPLQWISITPNTATAGMAFSATVSGLGFLLNGGAYSGFTLDDGASHVFLDSSITVNSDSSISLVFSGAAMTPAATYTLYYSDDTHSNASTGLTVVSS
jgi:hypothetical protein